MRNLKKFLALVLAMMMVMGLMVTVNAATFSDEANINDAYMESVLLLNKIKVLLGDENGFRPKDSITRAEFAKLIYEIDTGDTDLANAGSWAGLANFSDVSDNAWYAGVVAYAQLQGYVKGDNDIGGTYRPDDRINGIEAFTALARVLGEKVEGDNWEIVAATKAGQLGLNAGVVSGSGYYVNATREMAAQLVYNTLFYTSEATYYYVVYVDKNNNNQFNIGIDDVLWEGYDYDQAMLYAQSNGAMVDATETNVGSLAYVNFNGLRKDPNPGRDKFMRPSTIYIDNDYVGNNPVLKIEWKANATYNGTLTGKIAKTYGNNATRYTVYYNGVEVITTNPANDAVPRWQKDGATGKAGLWFDDDTGINGYEIEIYKMGTANAYDIIVREAYVAQVGATTGAGNTATTLLTVYERGGWGAYNKASGTFANSGYTGVPLDIKASTLSKFEAGENIGVYVKPSFSTVGQANGDTVLLEAEALVDHDITIFKINDVGYAALSSVLTTGGATWKVANEALHVPSPNATPAPVKWGDTNAREVDVGPTTLYTLHDNILLFDDNQYATTSTGYAYLYDYTPVIPGTPGNTWESDGGSSTSGASAAKIRMITTDQKVIEAELGTVTGGTPDNGTTRANNFLGRLVWYSYNSFTGKYDITLIADHAADINGSNVLEVTNRKSEAKVPGSSQKNIAFDADTVFMVVTTGITKAGAIDWSKVKFYDIYNVPNILLNTAGSALRVTAAKKLVSGVGAADVATGEIAGAVLIVDAGVSGTTNGYYFVLGGNLGTGEGTDKLQKTRVYRDSTETSYWEYIEYKAVVNGVLGTVKVKVYDSELSGVALSSLIANEIGNNIKFVKNPIVDENDCIVDWGTDVSTGSGDTNVLNNGRATSKNVADHITITLAAPNAAGLNQEDYLVSEAIGSVVYKYDIPTQTLKAIDPKTIAAKTCWIYAIRNTEHTEISALFLNMT